MCNDIIIKVVDVEDFKYSIEYDEAIELLRGTKKSIELGDTNNAESWYLEFAVIEEDGKKYLLYMGRMWNFLIPLEEIDNTQ